VLVVGLGPAGFTLAHHLMNDGHTVVGIDGLKIEPLPAGARGRGRHGQRAAFAPVRDVRALYEPLDARHGRASAASPNTASPCAGTRTS
jgi:glycine/D-amino acid oxidase-like deaminating enzyme